MDHWKPLLLTIVLLGSPSSHAEPQASVDGQRFAEGMTVMFPGKQGSTSGCDRARCRTRNRAVR